MPNPCIIWGAWIFPVTIIKEQPSISPRMNHVLTGSPTAARLFLPISLTLLKHHSPPSVKSQGALWQRHTVCLSNTCSESEMSCQSPTKAAPPLCAVSSQENTRSKTHESRLGKRWPCLGVSTQPQQTPQALSVPLLPTVSSDSCHVPCSHQMLALGWAKMPELAWAPAQTSAFIPSQDGSLPTPSVCLH